MDMLIRQALAALIVALLFMSAASAQDAAPSVESIHMELRAMKDRAAQAVNKKDIDALIKEVSPAIRFTAMNNEIVRGQDELRAYYAKMMEGASRIVEDMSINGEPDDLALLFSGNKMAIATGTSEAFFKIKGGLTFTAPLRWTATMEDTGGKWTIAAIQFSANMFDNPLLSAASSFWKWVAAACAVAGLALGFLIGRRRVKAA
jgi:ketosteroid isomerase-like protein